MNGLLFGTLLALVIAGSSSCLTKMGLVKNPCSGENFLKDLDSLNQGDIEKLARTLEANNYPHAQKNGCRAALLGQVYARQNNLELSSRYFAEAAEKLPELRQYFLLAQANLEVKRSNFLAAQQMSLALLNSQAQGYSPAFYLRVRAVLADIALQQKDDVAIIKTHRDLLSKGYQENEALLFNLGTALLRTGKEHDANEIFKRLMVEYPASKQAKDIEKLQPLAKYQLDIKQIEKRFEKLIANLAFQQAEDDKTAWSKNSLNPQAKNHVDNLSIKSLMLNNQFEKAIHRAHYLATRKHATELDKETYAWSLAKAGRYLDAAHIYGKLKKSNDQEIATKACFFHGFTLYEANLYALALLNWQSCENNVAGSSYHENMSWYQALSSILSSDYHRAITYLRRLNAQFPRSKESEKYHYFLGDALIRTQDISAGLAHLTSLSKKTSPSYFVLLARDALSLPPIASTQIREDTMLITNELLNRPGAVQHMKMLYTLGLKEEARETILDVNLPAREKIALLQHMNFYHDAWKRSYLLPTPITIRDNTVHVHASKRAEYPQPYRVIVDGASRKYGVHKSLLYAIMQAESGFLAQAVSVRGAVGLMQIMPFVAQNLALHVKTNFQSDQLKQPEISIELGAMLLAILERQFAQPHLVVAAYNAGAHQVQKWLSVFGDLPMDLFIERIPFKQTREYVKSVMASESLYRAMNGQNLSLATTISSLPSSLRAQKKPLDKNTHSSSLTNK